MLKKMATTDCSDVDHAPQSCNKPTHITLCLQQQPGHLIPITNNAYEPADFMPQPLTLNMALDQLGYHSIDQSSPYCNTQ